MENHAAGARLVGEKPAAGTSSAFRSKPLGEAGDSGLSAFRDKDMKAVKGTEHGVRNPITVVPETIPGTDIPLN